MESENLKRTLGNPLVSIIVITYNSSKYVLETLESAKAQTYQNIELIVSDDCSTDDTVCVCQNWIDENKDRFLRTKLIDAPVNTGIPANCNRGVNAANGEWIKLIAGDDALMPEAIKNNCDIVLSDIKIEILFSQLEVFKNEFKPENKLRIAPQELEKNPVFALESTPNMQLEWLLKGNYLPSPSLFIKRELLITYGFDEKYPLIEDLPLVLKLTINSNKIYYKNIITILYRKHVDGLTTNPGYTLPKYTFQYTIALTRTSFKYGNIIYILNSMWNLFFVKLIFLFGNKGSLCNLLNRFRMKLQPVKLFI